MFRTQKSPQSFRFNYQFRLLDFGKIPYPIIPITILYGKKKVSYDFVVDTGADITTLPIYVAHQLGIDLKSLGKNHSQGIGKELVETWESKLIFRIRRKEFEVRCSFINSNKIPPLLGKLDFFDKFNLYFDNENGRLVLTKR